MTVGRSSIAIIARRHKARRRGTNHLIIAVALAAVASCGKAQQHEGLDSGRNPTDVPLVHADMELADHLARVGAMISSDDYSEAIVYLHRLSEQASGALVDTGDGRRWVSLDTKINELIAQLAPEGQVVYRRMFDPVAKVMYDQAIESNDMSAMARVAWRYPHTRSGLLASDMMGAWCFARGWFEQATGHWQKALNNNYQDTLDEAMLLAKLACSLHLTGNDAAAAEMIDELESRFASRKAILAGHNQNIVEFARRIMTLEPTPLRISSCPGVMQDCEFSNASLWSFVADEGKVLAGDEIYARLPEGLRFIWDNIDGHVQLKVVSAGSQGVIQPASFVIPIIEPVVLNDRIYIRYSAGIIALNALTGEVAMLASLSMHRWSDQSAQPIHLAAQLRPSHTGQHSISAGDGMIFAVANFRPATGRTVDLSGLPTDSADTSELVALGADDLHVVWRIGAGKGDELVNNSRFLRAPTYHAGRLYVPISSRDNYYLVCLDASDGKLLWRSHLSQGPLGGHHPDYWIDQAIHHASPPVVSGQTVYAMSNRGVIGAFDAITGLALWAYQYDSTIAQAPRTRVMMGHIRHDPPPVNPIVVTGNRVIFAPADAEAVIALDARDGRMLWTVPAARGSYLSPIDTERALIAGAGLTVISIEDGGELYFSGGKKIIGSPAVTSTRVHASGLGRIFTLHLDDYRLDTQFIAAAATGGPSLLGNLISTDRELIAVNTMGVCSYVSYERAYSLLAQHIAHANDPGEAADFALKAARFANNSGRYDQALADAQQAQVLAEDANNADMLRAVKSLLHDVYVKLGDNAQGDDKFRYYTLAMSHACDDVSTASGLLRLAKSHIELARRERSQTHIREALAYLHKLGDEYPRLTIPDVAIGTRAGLRAPDSVPGAILADRHIADIIRRFGDNAYTHVDAKLKYEYERAKVNRDTDELTRIATTRRRSSFAPSAALAATRLLLDQARRDGSTAGAALAKCMELMSPLAAHQDSHIRVQAHIELAKTYFALADETAGRYHLGRAHIIQPFAADHEIATTPISDQPISASHFGGDVIEAFDTMGQASILQDQFGVPITIGAAAFVITPDRLLLVDTLSNAPKALGSWEGIVDSDAVNLTHLGSLSTGDDILLVASHRSLRAYDVLTAKLLWMNDINGKPSVLKAGDGAGVLITADTKIMCVDLRTGNVRWRREHAPSLRMPISIHRGLVGPLQDGDTTSVASISDGQIRGSWKARTDRPAQVKFLGSRVVVYIDGAVRVYDVDDLSKPVWNRQFHNPDQTQVLTEMQQGLIVSPRRGEVQMLSWASGGTIWRQTVRLGAMAPFRAYVHDGSVYAMSVHKTSVIRPRYPTPVGRRWGISRISVDNGELIWSREISTDRSIPHQPPVFCSERILLNVGPAVSSKALMLQAIDKASGEDLGRINMKYHVDDAQEFFMPYSPLVVTAGRCMTQTPWGVSVYDGR